MDMITDHINTLKLAIEKEVFLTEKTVNIVSGEGKKLSWIFDFRAVMLQPHVLNAYCEFFWEKYKDRYPFQVCGLEVAAVPLVAAIVVKFYEKGRPINGFFIRKSRKKSGLLKMVEGKVTEDPIIIVDDLVNSGSSIIRQLEILEERKVIEIFSILRFRNKEYYSEFKRRNVTFSSIFELNDFKETLGVSNLRDVEKHKSVVNPFESHPVWVFKGGSPNFFHVVPKSTPLFSDGRLYFGDDGGTFLALDTKSGERVWSYKVPFGSEGKFILSSPAIYKESVIFGAYDGNLYALDKRTGEKKWVFMEADWVGSSPCVSDDLKMVFIGLEFGLFRKRGGICGISAKTGEKIWEFRSQELTHGSPAYSKKFRSVGCGSNDGVFYMLEAKTGKLLWSFKTDGDIKYAPSFSDKHGVVVVLGFGDTVYVLNTKTGKLVSSYKMDFGGYSTPLIVGDKVICSSFDKHVHCFEILTGKLLWKYNTGARCFATPVLIEGNVYIGSNNARLFEIDPETGNVSGIFHTRERIVNKIAYDPIMEIFFIPTFANEIFALKRVKNN